HRLLVRAERREHDLLGDLPVQVARDGGPHGGEGAGKVLHVVGVRPIRPSCPILTLSAGLGMTSSLSSATSLNRPGPSRSSRTGTSSSGARLKSSAPGSRHFRNATP